MPKDKHIISADHWLKLFIKSEQKEENWILTDFFYVFRNDVITILIDLNFLNFHNVQKCKIMGFNLMYNFYLSWLKQNFSRGYKLLHVFWNTLYTLFCKTILISVKYKKDWCSVTVVLTPVLR